MHIHLNVILQIVTYVEDESDKDMIKAFISIVLLRPP